MNSLETAAEFFGWCTVINIGLYLLTVVGLTIFRSPVVRINVRIFMISEEDIIRMAFQYLGHYKLAITILNFVPYVALKILA